MVDQFSWAQNFGLNVEEENVASLQYRDQLQLLLTQNEDQSQRMPIGHQCLLLIAATQYHLLSHIYPENVQRYGVELLEYLKNKDELMFARFTELEPDKYIQERHVSVATRHIKQFDDKIFRN
jgi:F0F1-type ATP synthase alpha subunit